MEVRELNRDQLATVKINYYDSILQETENRTISYLEIANIHDIVTDETIFTECAGIDFTEDDFLK